MVGCARAVLFGDDDSSDSEYVYDSCCSSVLRFAGFDLGWVLAAAAMVLTWDTSVEVGGVVGF